MGREIRRVPLDFTWPRGQVWSGFVRPESNQITTCPSCKGDGYSPTAKLLEQLWYCSLHEQAWQKIASWTHEFILDNWELANFAVRILASGKSWSEQLDERDIEALVVCNRLWDFTRVPRTLEQLEVIRAQQENGNGGWLPAWNGYTPNPAEVNNWSKQGLGHDSVNSWICIKARCLQYDTEATCVTCAGHGEYGNDPWERQDPPIGEGWQLWETTSEGSPISPIFESEEFFAQYLCDQGYSEGAIRNFIEMGVAPSFIMVDGHIKKDIEGLA